MINKINKIVFLFFPFKSGRKITNFSDIYRHFDRTSTEVERVVEKSFSNFFQKNVKLICYFVKYTLLLQR